VISLVAHLALDDGGQDLIEYALLSAVLGVACITALLGLSQMREFLARAGQALVDAL